MGIINKGDFIGVESQESGVLEKETNLSVSFNFPSPLKHETDFSESVTVS